MWSKMNIHRWICVSLDIPSQNMGENGKPHTSRQNRTLECIFCMLWRNNVCHKICSLLRHRSKIRYQSVSFSSLSRRLGWDLFFRISCVPRFKIKNASYISLWASIFIFEELWNEHIVIQRVVADKGDILMPPCYRRRWQLDNVSLMLQDVLVAS